MDKNNNASFKGSGAVLGAVGSLMQGVENKGYFASFLIQDVIGMTGPRTITGFNRDREITGKINTQEGFEVLFREGLTGPYMMAVAPAILFLTTKFCKSTNTNTNLIKRYGESLKDFVKNSENTQFIKDSASKFKSRFIRFNLEEIYKNSVPNDKNPAKTINLIMSEFENLNSKDKKLSKKSLDNIVNIINEKILQTDNNFYRLNKLTVGTEKTKKEFNIKDVIKSLNDFCDDAIINNPDYKNIDEIAAENIKNNFASKRILTNIANIAATLGGLSIIPKIYAKNDISPSAVTIQHLKEQAERQKQEENNLQNNEISFKARGINSSGVFSKIGEFITKYMPEKMSELLEYTGINFTKTMFAGLSIFGLLFPRGLKAVSRAQVDENGKKDYSELKEILVRDTISSLTVVFAVPILTKIFINSFEKKLGFIMMKRPDENRNALQRFLDVINPYSKLEVLPISDLESIYGNINSKSKLMNFAHFIDKNGGDLEKILSESNHPEVVFNEKTFKLESIKSLPKQEKNKRIIDELKRIITVKDSAENKKIIELMKGTKQDKVNKIMRTVKGLNSLPAFIATFVISPVLLGVFIPKLTYKNTRKMAETTTEKS